MKPVTGIFSTAVFFALLAAIVTGAVLQMPETAAAIPWRLQVKPENRTVLLPGPGQGRILIQVDAPPAVPGTDRAPLNLCLVMDRSGSMSDAGKMEYALRAAHQLIDSMGEEDILSIVAYDHRVKTLASGVYAGNRRKLHRIVDGIHPNGRTNLSGGLEEGFRRARRYRRKGYVNRILLLSDGLANVGLTDRAALRQRASAMAEDGVSVSTFGVGYNFDEQLLAMVANGGGGSYHYIARPADIVAALGQEFDMVSATMATGVEIIIRPLGGSRLDGISGYRWEREGRDIVVGLGDLSAGESRTLTAALQVAGSVPGSVDVAEVSIRYSDPVTGRVITGPADRVHLEVVRDQARFEAGFDDKVVSRGTVIRSNETLEKAAGKVDTGDRDGALKILKDAERELKAAPASPESERALEENQAYQDQLGNIQQMEPADIRKMQKGVRYRAYEELFRK